MRPTWGGRRVALILLLLALAAVACAAPAGGPSRSQPAESVPVAPKRMIAAITGDPHTFSNKLNPQTNVPGIDRVEELINMGLTRRDNRNGFLPGIADAVPSIENGLWKLTADGRMETTWRIRPSAAWHDGMAFTAADVRFSVQVAIDGQMPNFIDPAFELVDRIDAPDERTVVLYWKAPYIDADSLFTVTSLPRHVLAQTYAENREGFLEHPYWTSEFIGTGPFKIRDWVRGSHVVLVANDAYVLGRPGLDEIEVKFIPDQNTLIANILAGAVDVVLSRGLSLDQGMQARDQWRDGRMELTQRNWVALYPQFINPNPSVMSDVRFRRALLHAIDRQQLADVIYAGLVPVAHSILNPSEPFYKDIERNVVKYDYDQRRSAQMIEGLGYTRGPDGLFRDASGQVLAVQIRSSATRAERTQMLFALVESWQAVGVAAEADIVPPQRVGDLEYRATFPGVEFTQQPNTVSGLKNFFSARAPVPETRFIGNNRARYRNPEVDATLNQLFATIPFLERTQVLGRLIYHFTDQLPSMGILYGVDTHLIANRLKNVGADEITWNAHEWTLN
ncbi:MAG TPA: ABC transporter substrate-binding protein [Rhodothermia bacterium]|nr:ABC transporter substrate-binding protein [Rhodothermia bacterium]